MTTPRVETENYLPPNKSFSSEHIHKLIDPIIPPLERAMKSYVAFNMFFLTLGFIEFFFLIIFFAFLAKSSVLSLSLAFVFLTFFSYFTLRIYFQTKKPEQFKEIKERYIAACKNLINYQEGVAEHHVALANACCKLADSLHHKEYTLYKLPSWLEFLSPNIEKFSCWWHWQDVHRMKEILLMAAVNEHIMLVKCEPTSLEVHASLANAYVMLSGLYADPRKMEGWDEDRWMPEERFSEALEQKFRATAERAIEEFKIMNNFAPNDPWVHVQLAYSYRDLQMPSEEIREYETIMKLNSNDKETLFKLGVLYFQQGLNAQGLRVYEELKRFNPKRAESLINHYGGFTL